METGVSAELPRSARLALGVQRAVCALLAPLTVTAGALGLRWGLGLRFEGLEALRAAYREERRAHPGPLLVCANHLTMIDSFLIGYALGSPAWYVWNPRDMPWNVPDRNVFAARFWHRVLTYVFKCLLIERGGERVGVAETLARFAHLLRRGDVGMVFPEGGRSRSGRVQVEVAAWGVGRVVRAVPGCRVLCVYLRGDAQESYGGLPRRGDTIRADLSWLEPKTDLRGLRASREVSRQILARLAEMEARHLAVH